MFKSLGNDAPWQPRTVQNESVARWCTSLSGVSSASVSSVHSGAVLLPLSRPCPGHTTSCETMRRSPPSGLAAGHNSHSDAASYVLYGEPRLKYTKRRLDGSAARGWAGRAMIAERWLSRLKKPAKTCER
jgi:hypothetical protein